MLYNNRITIEEYSPAWQQDFYQLRAVYQSRLGSYVIGIEHVGSTSVEGLSAKPILDIDLIVADGLLIKPVIKALEYLDYQHIGDLGITGREAFKRASALTPTDGSGRSWPAHNLYVCLANSVSLKNHLAFRNYLRTHPAKARAYGELKKKLATENPHNINAYAGAKTDFITGVLKEMGFDAAALDDIARQNLPVK